MRVLITGITGFVGSHLVEYILAHQPQTEIVGIKRWRSPKDNIRHLLNKIRLYDCDLNDLGSLIRVFGEVKPDVIFHLAAQSFVPTSYNAPADTLHTNVIGTCNLLEAVRILKLDPVIHICSSSEVYGQVKPDEVPIRETCPLRPVSPYAVSKVGEDMLAFMRSRPKTHCVKTWPSSRYTAPPPTSRRRIGKPRASQAPTSTSFSRS